MCELLSLAFNQAVSASISFRGFRHRAKTNPHGWGLATFFDGSAQIFKEPYTGHRSRLSRFVRDYQRLQSRIFIAHVRYGSIGEQSYVNTHPFSREIRGGDFVLAHNGTLDRGKLCSQLDDIYTPIGDTDSEAALCVLLNRIRKENTAFDDFPRIAGYLQELNTLGTMSMLLSQGEFLYAYRDSSGKKQLFWVERTAPFPVIKLLDEEWKGKVTEDKNPEQKGVLFATKPITNERWQELPPGCLCVVQRGELVYRH